MRNLIFLLALAMCITTVAQRPKTTTAKKPTTTTQRTAAAGRTTAAKAKSTTAKTNAAKGQSQFPVQMVSKASAGRVVYEEVVYNIQGTVHGFADGTQVKLCNAGDKGMQPHDSTTVRNGKFSFKGACPNVPYMNFIVLGEGVDKTLVEVFLEKGIANVDITAGERIDKVQGTTHNNIYAPYRDSINAIYRDIYHCIMESNRLTNTPEERQSYKLGADSLRQKIIDTSYEFTRRNLSNWVGMYLFAKYYKTFTAAQNKALIARVPQKYAQIPVMNSIRAYVKKQK